MIWIWLLARSSHKWGTGPLDWYFAFICARCGVTTPAMVRTFGFGSGNSQWAAERSAHASADAFAYRATTAAACPHCSELQPQLLQQFEHAAKKVASRGKLRVPLTIGLAVLVLILLAIPAIADLRYSVTLTTVAMSAATAVGALVFTILAGPVITPNTNPNGVWFSRDPSQGPGSWFVAQPGRAPQIQQPASILRILSGITLAVTAVSAIVGLVLWSDTFRKVYVVSSDGPARDLTVKVDGKEVGTVTQHTIDDAPNLSFEVRTGSKHEVVVVGPDKKELTYELDPKAAKHGWAITPRAHENGLCLATIHMYYGTTPKEGDDKLLNEESDLVVLPYSFDHVLTPAPATIQTQNGATETRSSLRALDCHSLTKENIVSFKNAPPRTKPSDTSDPSEP